MASVSFVLGRDDTRRRIARPNGNVLSCIARASTPSIHNRQLGIHNSPFGSMSPPGGPPRVSWYNESGLMNDWRSKTGKHAERVRQEAERARQASMEVYRKALKSIRTRAPGWRAKVPAGRAGRMGVGLS